MSLKMKHQIRKFILNACKHQLINELKKSGIASCSFNYYRRTSEQCPLYFQ